MIKALILYFLSIKPTHGYEIQKYIQINHMDSWTKIQSGSIYYALSKLEKEELITLHKEEKTGGKVRKIYKITDEGREALVTYLEEELNKEIYDTGSDKFISYPLLGMLNKDTLIEEINKHIEMLRLKKSDIEKWQNVKVNDNTLQVESTCFEMMISSLSYQIKWHKVLLEEIDQCINLGKQMSNVIKKVDFSSVNDSNEYANVSGRHDIEALKKEILDNPDTAAEKLEQLIKILGK